ncbi:DUF1194 domain-containing protein [Lacimicrobium alkaliphilum]|uniref:VWFA domain-containing protein n=1 Tax=Lacimicrobium alkaliphilum TaxID=1526571 RepID=A0ABQ1QXM4_9ALTE|nr:DUF1194 domain-containing protein [Lacimicrobium alkaliphilum]GGD50273.1 hypothetical protein GCM10011357_02770 [Lacimicrobium alkaliphilum]
MFRKFFAALFFAGALSGAAQADLIETDLELQLLADVSGSVDSSEYALQLTGYANAFRSSTIIDAITSGAIGSIAVQYIEWSGSTQQQVQVDWMLIDSTATSNAFADALENVSRAFSGMTAIGSALDFGAGLFATNDFTSSRKVVDVSGDGALNDGISVQDGQSAVLNAGIDVINGITIGNEGGLQDFYQQNVIAGTDAFHIHAEDFADFSAGIEQKLEREIRSTPVSEPATMVIFALGVAGMALSRRRKV